MENPIKMDDLGVPLFLETPKYFLFSPRSLAKWSNLTNIFPTDWNHQLEGFFFRELSTWEIIKNFSSIQDRSFLVSKQKLSFSFL